MARRQVTEVQGSAVPWARDLRRFAVTLHEQTLTDLKVLALTNNRTVCNEIRTIVESAVKASKRLEDER